MRRIMGMMVALALCGLGMGAAYAEDGAALFKSKGCPMCHGAGKKGGDLKSSTLDKAAMVKYIKDPKAANPKATMPAVKGSDAELNAIADYVKTMK
ncbi:MAG: cytochrome c [Deltaproteobacteria bacterium]|nr:cytochrome c [Deltaproteobacteria bacterium]